MYWLGERLEQRGLAGATIRRKLAALVSLFNHLLECNAVTGGNPVHGVKRPRIETNEGKTAGSMITWSAPGTTWSRRKGQCFYRCAAQLIKAASRRTASTSWSKSMRKKQASR